MRKLIGTLGVAGALLIAPMANAAFVSQWDYTVTLDWTDATFSGGGGTPSFSPDILSWGATGGNHENQGLPAAESRSALEISNSPADGVAITNGPPAPTNTVTHWNNAILASFASLETATALSTLTLTPLVPPGDPRDTVEREFTVRFTETFNEPTPEDCPFESESACDDIFTIVLGQLSFSFNHEGFLYTVTIVELSGNLGPLSDAQCAAANAAPGCVGILTRENEAQDVNFGILITAVPVPEPSVLALLGIGLLGLGAMRRKNG